MKLKSKRSISFPEDGQTPPAWLTLTVTLMVCYATIVAFGLLRPSICSHPEAKTSAWTAARATAFSGGFNFSRPDLRCACGIGIYAECVAARSRAFRFM
jgi:hypothetical protein